MSRRVTGTPLVFDGETDDVEQFLNTFSYEAIMFAWSEEAQAEAIKYCLTGKALRYYNDLNETDRKSIKAIKKKLKECLAKAPEYYLNLFYMRAVKPNESIASFCHAIQQLLDKGMPGLEPATKGRLLRSRLIAVAPENLKNFLEMLADKTWDEVVAILDKSTDYRAITAPTLPEIALNKAEVVRQWSTRSSSRPQERFGGICYYCNKPGHKQLNCRSRLQAAGGVAQRSFGSNGGRVGGHRQQPEKRSYDQPQRASRPYDQPQHTQPSREQTRNEPNHRPQLKPPQESFCFDAWNDDELILNAENAEEECNTVEIESFMSESKPEKLVRLDVQAEIGSPKTTVTLPMLVDCGSSSSFVNPEKLPSPISEEVSDFINKRKSPKNICLSRLRLSLKSALDSKSPMECAKGKMKIKIGEWVGDHEFIFMNIKETAILGLDFWRRKKANFDFEEEKIFITDNEKTFKIYDKNERVDTIDSVDIESSTCLLLGRKVKLKPNTEHLLKIKVPKNFRREDTFIFESGPLKEIDLKKGLVWANSVSKIDDEDNILLSAMNLSDSEIDLNADYEVGTLDRAEIFTVERDENDDTWEPKPSWKTLEINSKLSVDQRTRLLNLLRKYENVFQWNENDCGLTVMAKHDINTGDAKPVKQRPYRLPEAAKKEVDRQIKTMIKNNVIEESRSPWCSPIILVKKKGDKGKTDFRFCVDFRKLNSLTVKDAYTLPRIDETIDALGGSWYFTPLDCSGGFWQVPMDEKDREKTAFCANSKLYQFKVMPFGLCNAPSTFQRLMDNVLKNLTWKYCLVYLDDVIVFSKDFDSHLVRLNEILSRFEEANLKLKPSKCRFLMEKVNYLGFLISREGVSPDPAKIRAIVDIKALVSREEVKRFLGMMSYYRRFIKDFGTTAACLFELTRPNSEFKWYQEADEAFKKLKEQLVNAPILIYPDFERPFEIFSDASGVAIGAVLVQRRNEVIHPLAFASRQLSATERNYSTSEREMLAIVWAAKHFNAYIYGRHIKFYTDHKPLSTLNKVKEPNGRLYKLLLKLQDLDYEIIYYPGVLNYTADFLSRYQEKQVEENVNALELEMSIDWADEQNKDRELAIVKMSVKNGDENNLSDSPNEDVWRQNRPFLCVKTEVLLLKNHGGDELVVVPSHLRTKVCSMYHDSITGGHMGFERTYRAIESRFYWPKMKAFVFDHCSSCDICQRFKVKHTNNVWPLVSIKVNKPWDLLGLDYAGPLKLTPRGSRHFVLGIDYCSKLIMARATPDSTTDTTIKFVKEEIINKHGPPVAILSDQGRNFEAKDFDSFCSLNGIRKIRTTSYHPQCNGLAERSIRTIKQMIASFVNEKHDDWDLRLGEVVFTYNNTVQSSTGFAPNQVIFGRLLPTISDRKLNIEAGNTNLSHNEIVSEVSQKIEKAQRTQKTQYDEKIKNKAIYETGDLVVLANTRQVVGHVRSFEPKYIGPYEVIRKTGEANYELLDPKTGKTNNVHYNRMSKYKARNKSMYEERSESVSDEPRVFSTLDEVLMSARELAIINMIQSRRAVKGNEGFNFNQAENLINEQEVRENIQARDPPIAEVGHPLVDNEYPLMNNEHPLENNKFLENDELEEEVVNNALKGGELIYKCEECEKKFDSIKGLKIHKTRIHKSEK